MSEVTTSFYYMGIDTCARCAMPNHLFVCSSVVDSSEYNICLDCWKLHFYYETDKPTYPDEWTHTAITPENHSTCDACEYPIIPDHQRWGATVGYLADATPIKVHANCLVPNHLCRTCEIPYARTRYRTSNRSDSERRYSGNLFMEYHQTDGSLMCNNCHESYLEDNGGEDNWFMCPSCSNWRSYDDSYDYEGDTYCEGCYDNYVYTCSNCGNRAWDGDGHDCDDYEDDVLIHSYSYRPSPYFIGQGNYHFGFELEVESRGGGRYDGARLVTNQLGASAYIKEDGSLSDGFEIVTHPHTLEKYQMEFDWRVLDKLKSEGFRSWNTSTCGLHVHVSRSAFGDGDPYEYPLAEKVRAARFLNRQAHELRFMKLIYDNQRQVERIAGRSNNSYATFMDKGNLTRKIKYGEQRNGRYSAINTENDSTIEVRVFKGSLRKERVLSAIEFVHACVEYTRDVKVNSKNLALSWLKFTGYVSAHAEMYPNLVTIMSESFAGDSNPDEN